MKQFVKVLMANFIMITPLLVTIGNSKTSDFYNPNSYDRVFIFGDDLSDTGAFFKYAGRSESTQYIEGAEIFSKWKTPTVNSVFNEFPFSNNKVAVHSAVMDLKLSDPSPFVDMLDVASIKNNLEWDSSFATVGARIAKSDLKSLGINPKTLVTKLFADRYSLEQQVDMFYKNYSSYNGSIKSLGILSIGMNDIIDIIEDPIKQTPEIRAISENKLLKLGHILDQQVRILKSHGINDFIIWNLPDLSRFPKYLNADSDKRELAFDYTFKFNEIIEKVVSNLKQISNLWNVRIFDFNKHFENYLDISVEQNDNIIVPALKFDLNTQFLKGDYFATYNKGVDADNMKNYTFATETHLSFKTHKYLGNQLYKFINS